MPAGLPFVDGRGRGAALTGERAAADIPEAPRDRNGRLDVDDEQRLLEAGRTGEHLAVVVQDHGMAVEDELVLASHGVDERDEGDVVARASGEHLLALALLSEVERRRRQVGDQLRTRERHLRRRRARLPDVLTDGRADENVPVLEQEEVVAGREVAVLVEDAVVGQEALAVDGLDLAGRADRTGVVEVAVEVRRAHERDDPAGGPRDLLQRALRRPDEAGAEQEVLRRVAGDRELGEEDEVGARVLGLGEATEDALAVAVEVADDGVDLGECESHRDQSRFSPLSRKRSIGSACTSGS